MNLFDLIEADWPRVGRSIAARRSLADWSAADRPLQRFEDLCELVAFTRDVRHPLSNDAVLACLARRTSSDQLAARTVFESVLPGLVRIGYRYRAAFPSDDDAASAVVTAAYERIRTYLADRRPKCIAPNILLDTRQVITRAISRRRVVEVACNEFQDRSVVEESPSVDEELVGFLRSAVADGQLRPSDARLIGVTRVGGIAIEELAEGLGVRPRTLIRRRQRAERSVSREEAR